MSDSPELGKAPPSVEIQAARLAGKYMMFEVAQEAYGLALLDVRELDGLMPITRVPGSPAFVRGVIDLRGQIVMVIDLRARFGFPPTADTEQTVVIVVQGRVAAREMTVGLLGDRVLEVVSLEASAIEPPPELAGCSAMAHFLLGVGKLPNRVVFLLDIEKILTAAERPTFEASLARMTEARK